MTKDEIKNEVQAWLDNIPQGVAVFIATPECQTVCMIPRDETIPDDAPTPAHHQMAMLAMLINEESNDDLAQAIMERAEARIKAGAEADEVISRAASLH